MIIRPLLVAAAGWMLYSGSAAAAKKPNIVLIMSDDQDYRLGSLDTQSVVQKEIVSEGVLLTNHFVTTAQCCPSRVAFHRGQMAHNTNNTHVMPAGGGYSKFLASGEDEDYLPHWLKKAGYRTGYIGKLFNGLNLANYSPKPKGWDYTDVLVDPYTYSFNNVVMSTDGDRPIWYRGYHQTDVIRAKAVSKLENLTAQDEPFYLSIAPASPHVEGADLPVPLKRHEGDFPNATVPKPKNFNPTSNYTQMKVSWLRNLSLLNDEQIERADLHHRRRLQALQGLDEIVEDVIKVLKEKKALDNTYIIYTTDNGYHIGNHRVPSGKSLPYIEDTNVPMVIRGPRVPRGKVSKTPSTHIDMAPTFLDIAQLPDGQQPPFLDGRSLLDEWTNLMGGNGTSSACGSPKEIINVEFWGSAGIEDPVKKALNESRRHPLNSYKTVRIVGESSAWLFSRWCTNETELYDTVSDPHELINLAPNPSHDRLIHRLNALLLVTKSCGGQTCRNPWSAFTPATASNTTAIQSLDDAMDHAYDDYFASFPAVSFGHCMDYQYIPNEVPFFPDGAIDLGREFRQPTDNFTVWDFSGATRVPGSSERHGTEAQRNVTLETILKTARELTEEEMGTKERCYYPDYCDGGNSD